MLTISTYQVACQPSADLVKQHFVHIFSISMALHCSKKAGSGNGYRVLGTYILQIAELSEHERDELIKKRMVRVHDLVSIYISLVDNAIKVLLLETWISSLENIKDSHCHCA